MAVTTTVKPNPNVNARAKKPRENLCHDKSSSNYSTLKYFVTCKTMDECLGSGGRAALGVFLTTAVAFFLVEMGDKTQVATVALAAQFHSILGVVLGTTIGMMLAIVPVVYLGDALHVRIAGTLLRKTHQSPLDHHRTRVFGDADQSGLIESVDREAMQASGDSFVRSHRSHRVQAAPLTQAVGCIGNVHRDSDG
jgi:hypothetical protein